MKNIKDNLNLILQCEEELILAEICKKFEITKFHLKRVNYEIINQINTNLHSTDESNVAFKIHRNIINTLTKKYILSRFKEEKLEQILKHYPENEISLDYITEMGTKEIPELLEKLHITYLNSEFIFVEGRIERKRSKHHLRENGAVYTLKIIAKQIVENTIARAVNQTGDYKKLRCLDFGSGTGRFYFEALDFLINNSKKSIESIICNNLFAIDIDDNALTILKCKVLERIEKITPRIQKALFANIRHQNALVLKKDFSLKFESENEESESYTEEGFDVILSNPPYYLLKANKKEESIKADKYYNHLRDKVRKEVEYFKTSGDYEYSIEGMLNYYKLSIERIINLLKPNGQLGVICPNTIFSDLTATKLRKFILEKNILHQISYYPETAKLFENVNQSTVIFHLQKGGATGTIEVEFSGNRYSLEYPTIKNIFPQKKEIPLIEDVGWEILKKMSNKMRLKDLTNIRNRRGELDLTKYKNCIVKENTGWRLVRGNMITKTGIVNKNNEFVKIEEFLSQKSEEYKEYDLKKKRLICQQISNMEIQKRLNFVFTENNDILGNSCNYISNVNDNRDLEKLYYILNSELMNWRFKITSSNNHINNYELDELPIIELENVNLNEFSDNEEENNKLICKLYDLNEIETQYIMNQKRKKN